MTRHMSGEYIAVSNGKHPVSNVKKRAKMLMRFVLGCKLPYLSNYIFGSFNATKTKIPRSIQCNNMSSFIAIVLVDVTHYSDLEL